MKFLEADASAIRRLPGSPMSSCRSAQPKQGISAGPVIRVLAWPSIERLPRAQKSEQRPFHGEETFPVMVLAGFAGALFFSFPKHSRVPTIQRERK